MRDKRYLSYVRSYPCLTCGGEAQAHHVQFAGTRGVGMKVGDEHCVPLCALCHYELHNFGHEKTWWALKGIDPIQWAAEARSKWNER